MAVLVFGRHKHRVGTNQNIDTMMMMTPFRDLSGFLVGGGTCQVENFYLLFSPSCSCFDAVASPIFHHLSHIMSPWPANLIVAELIQLSNSLNDLAVLG